MTTSAVSCVSLRRDGHKVKSPAGIPRPGFSMPLAPGGGSWQIACVEYADALSPVSSPACKTVSLAVFLVRNQRTRNNCDPLSNQAVSLIGGYVDHLHPPPQWGRTSTLEVCRYPYSEPVPTNRGESGVTASKL